MAESSIDNHDFVNSLKSLLDTWEKEENAKPDANKPKIEAYKKEFEKL